MSSPCPGIIAWFGEVTELLEEIIGLYENAFGVLGPKNLIIQELSADAEAIQGWTPWVAVNCEAIWAVAIVAAIINAVEAIVEFAEEALALL
jgi:hypothetical protein